MLPSFKAMNATFLLPLFVRTQPRAVTCVPGSAVVSSSLMLRNAIILVVDCGRFAKYRIVRVKLRNCSELSTKFYFATMVYFSPAIFAQLFGKGVLPLQNKHPVWL